MCEWHNRGNTGGHLAQEVGGGMCRQKAQQLQTGTEGKAHGMAQGAHPGIDGGWGGSPNQMLALCALAAYKHPKCIHHYLFKFWSKDSVLILRSIYL